MGRHGPKPRRDELIIELRRQGYSLDETAHRAGVSSTTVYNCMRRHGLVGQYRAMPPQNKSRREPEPRGRAPQYDQRILELRRNGLSLDAIAREIGCSSKTVYAGLRRHGLTKASRKKAAKPKRKAPASVDRAFTLVIIGERAGIKVLPTSEAQYERLLAMLQDAGGEVI